VKQPRAGEGTNRGGAEFAERSRRGKAPGEERNRQDAKFAKGTEIGRFVMRLLGDALHFVDLEKG